MISTLLGASSTSNHGQSICA
uniref:Uncharacterized protein n=1 Tax=Solanum lycopersicum TaxID=4081 RepID=K4B855_SOLLC